MSEPYDENKDPLVNIQMPVPWDERISAHIMNGDFIKAGCVLEMLVKRVNFLMSQLPATELQTKPIQPTLRAPIGEQLWCAHHFIVVVDDENGSAGGAYSKCTKCEYRP